MVIEGIGIGPSAVRPKGAGTVAERRDSDTQVGRAVAPESVDRAADRVELTPRAANTPANVDSRAADQPAGDLSEARTAEIRSRLASGFYETEIVLEAIINGVILDAKDLLPK